MKIKKIKIVFLIVISISLIYCTTNDKDKNALSYYSELDLNIKHNILSKKEKKKGWQLLFDGISTEGWRGYNMEEFPDCWKIEDSCITMTSKGRHEESKDIITKTIYKGFALSVEVKLTKGSNSGIIYHVAEDPKYGPGYTGPEFQIIDHDNWPTPLKDWQTNGSNYAMYPPKVKPYKEIGEWNHYFLVVNGNKVTQILNGEIVVEYEKYSDEWKKRRNSGKWAKYPCWGKFNEGYIAFQNHGTKVWFRSIKLKVLD